MSNPNEKRSDPEIAPEPIEAGDILQEKRANVDDAFIYVHEHHIEPLTPAEDKKILRKIDNILMPMVCSFTDIL